ncbi:hypothetical protein TSUD_13700 [Trifolium subterraneum]|uniref:Uncharacterized protein n=1 Tax=Trifolium subterraneum TaxID=3900 RepID=A0A2Z6PBH5_TRISU|nr:hypothetical protein TSUD_13700 [Trifolium subterraneum]
MAVGKRLKSRDEHLMLIIPMLGVTNLRGDVRCSAVGRCWACTLGLARRPNRGGPQRVGHLGLVQNRSPPSYHARARGCLRGCDLKGQAALSSADTCKGYWNINQVPSRWVWVSRTFLDRWIFVPFGFCDGRIWTVGLSFIVAVGLTQRFRLEWRNKVRAGVMADEGVQRKIPVERNINWVADDPRTTPSKFEFEENFPEDLFTDIEIPGHADWEVRIPGANQRICTTFKNGGFPMYQIAFEHMGLRLPFTDLEMAIFNHLEIVAAYLELAPTVPLFFHIFGIQRSRPRWNVTDKCGWVSLKQHKKFFDIFEESLRGFKDKWFVVRPITSAGWKTILVRGPKLDDEGRVKHRDDGEPIEVDCERFPFCWSKRHYAREAKSFTFKKGDLSKEELAGKGDLSKEELADLKVLEIFVEELPPSLWEDREGNPVCEEEGYQLSSKKYINTKALLKCATRVEAEDLLREMKNTQVTLRKLAAEKKKRALGASSSTPNISEQTSPSPSIEVTGERRVEEMAGDGRPPKSARVAGGGSGPHRLIPGKSAEETRMKISDADQSILASMGPESIRNVVAESSVAVFKLLEVATFLNGRECKYLQKRDEARAHAKEFGERLTVLEVDLSSETKALKESQGRVAQLEEDLKSARKDEETLKGQVAELEKKLASLTLSPVDEEERSLDPSGTYAKFSRADLISKIYQIGDLQLDVASSSFRNAVAQLQILNPEVQLITEGMDEMKEVRDGRIASPPLDEEDE